MEKKELLVIIDYSQETLLSLPELCEVCGISSQYVYDLMAFDIIHPSGETPDQWTFNLSQLSRIKTALRLQRDLEINLAGIALILDLMEEIKKLREQVDFLDRRF